MTEPEHPRLSLWVLLLVLGGFTLAGEWILFLAGLGAYALVVPVLAALVGLAYLATAAPARRPAASADDEPFEDPVEEALRPARPEASPGPEVRASTDPPPGASSPGPSDDADTGTGR